LKKFGSGLNLERSPKEFCDKFEVNFFADLVETFPTEVDFLTLEKCGEDMMLEEAEFRFEYREPVLRIFFFMKVKVVKKRYYSKSFHTLTIYRQHFHLKKVNGKIWKVALHDFDYCRNSCTT
jgi:hypothetical protein